ncbi:MAG: AMP-binding protein, partial [Pseudomonadales bacterium]
MGLVDSVRTLAQLPTLLKLKKGMVPRPSDVKDSFSARVEANAQRVGDRPAIVFEGTTLTWSELNAEANRYAHYFKSQGLQRGDTVSLIMENRVEFLGLLIGLNKLGVTLGLINTNLNGRPLAHCVNVTESKKCIFGAEVAERMEEVKGDLALSEGSDYFVVPDGDHAPVLNWAVNLRDAIIGSSTDNPPDTTETTIGETALYIFTSGTTGLPKAAVLSNRRYLISSDMAAIAGFKCTEEDRMYVCLPLYHGTGLM